MPETRTGYVTLAGRPNAGKSTLLNALIGEQLSIVTSKAQTTWERITGILTTSAAQMIFLDTPGLLEPRDLLQKTMLSAALEALREADVVLLVLDGAAPLTDAERGILRKSLEETSEVPLLAAVNKMDIASSEAVNDISEWVTRELAGEVYRISALEKTGVQTLVERMEDLLPVGPFLYPPDDIARDPVRFFVAEMVRESVFETFYQEIPYSTFCRVEEFRENQDPVYVQCHLFVERKSQKRILIGRKGSSIRALGSKARNRIEAFLGRSVYLDLWVKVLPDWRRRREHLRRLGFPVPEEERHRG